MGAGDALGPEDADRHHRRLLDRLHRSDDRSPSGAIAHDLTNSRIIIYAVRPFAWKDEFPKVNAVSSEYADKVRQKWSGKLQFLAKRNGG